MTPDEVIDTPDGLGETEYPTGPKVDPATL
jgi:hypothetical protein